MALRLRTWADDEISVRMYLSITGDFVALGEVREYPFISGGANGTPAGWMPHESAPTTAGMVSRSVGMGRFNIATNTPTVFVPNMAGAWRDFAVTPNRRYQFQIQARTIDGRTTATRSVLYQWNGTGTTFGTSRASQSDWEQIGMTAVAPPTGTTFVRIFIVGLELSMAAAATNWGVQYQSFRTIELEAAYPDPTWREITCDVQAVNTRYGRDKVTSRFDVASLTARIQNDDGDFSYTPNHKWGLRPGRFIRATIQRGNGQEFPLYYGIIDGMTDTYTLDGHAFVNMQCVDISSLLSNINVMTVGWATSEYLSGERFERLANSASWIPQRLTRDAGSFLQQVILANGRSIREEMGITADSEGGYFFADREGSIVFRGRTWTSPTISTVTAEVLATPECKPPLIRTDSFPTVANPVIVEANQLATNWGRDRIVNHLQLANQNGTAFTFTDAESQRRFGPITYQRLDFVNSNLASRADQLALRAADIMEDSTDATLRINSVTFRPQPSNYDWMVRLWLNDVLRVRYELASANGWGYAIVTRVQAIEQSLTLDDWLVTLALDDPESFVYWDTSDNGWDVGLWDQAEWDS